MKYGKIWGVAMLIAGIGAAGCSSSTTSAKPKAGTTGSGTKAGHAAHGAGPNGGVVFDLGKFHAEFTVNHDKKECTILMIDGDTKDAKPLAVAAKEFTVTTKETKTKDGKVVAPMTIKMMPSDEKDGKSSKFVGTDPGLGNVADFEGTVTGEIGGKPSQGEFKEG